MRFFNIFGILRIAPPARIIFQGIVGLKPSFNSNLGREPDLIMTASQQTVTGKDKSLYSAMAL
jgi:hypothetical protein